MRDVIDILILVLFVLFMIALLRGFNQTMMSRHKEREEERKS